MKIVVLILMVIGFSGCSFIETRAEKRLDLVKERAECNITKQQNIILKAKVKALQDKLY